MQRGVTQRGNRRNFDSFQAIETKKWKVQIRIVSDFFITATGWVWWMGAEAERNLWLSVFFM